MKKILGICKNIKCNREFLYDKWRHQKYCNLLCANSDLQKNNPMRNKSLKLILIEKYGKIDGFKKHTEVINKISKTSIKLLSNLNNVDRSKLRGRNGSQNGMYNKNIKNVLLAKYGNEEGNLKIKNLSEKNSNSKKNKKRKPETITKIRLAKIKRIEDKIKKGLNPRYNPIACNFIDKYGIDNNYNFQHAENGGEIYLKNIGYFLDGYDKIKNTVIEFYERFHYNIFGVLKEKEIRRENDIIKYLKCKFIRINAFDKNNLKYEIVK